MSTTGLRQQLDHIEGRLSAWMTRDADFADHPNNPADFESKARTFLCFLENVFGRFYEFKTRLCDYDDIPASYGADWERFRTDACTAARDAQPFNGICAVMHLQAAPEGGAYAIQNVGLRPCAIEQSFLRVMLKHLAQSLADTRPLVIKVFGVRVEFVNTVVEELRGTPNFKEPVHTQQDRLTFMGHKAESGRKVDVITFDSESVAALRDIKTPWTTSTDPTFPTAERLNDSSQASPKRADLLRRMIGLAKERFAEYLRGANDLTNYLPDALNLDENALWVYKGGEKLSFRPEERRFFIRDEDQRYFEIRWWAGSEKWVQHIDALQGRNSIRFEFANGAFVFFLLTKDFARTTVANRQRIELNDTASVRRVMTAIVMDGEKIVGTDGSFLVLTQKREDKAVVVWHRPPRFIES